MFFNKRIPTMAEARARQPKGIDKQALWNEIEDIDGERAATILRFLFGNMADGIEDDIRQHFCESLQLALSYANHKHFTLSQN